MVWVLANYITNFPYWGLPVFVCMPIMLASKKFQTGVGEILVDNCLVAGVCGMLTLGYKTGDFKMPSVGFCNLQFLPKHEAPSMFAKQAYYILFKRINNFIHAILYINILSF